MKNSGVEWIKEIPKNWKVNKIKYLFTSGKGLFITKENLIDDGLPVISYGQIHAKNNNSVDINKDLLRFVSYDYQKYNFNCNVKKMILFLLILLKIRMVVEISFIKGIIHYFSQDITQLYCILKFNRIIDIWLIYF